MTLLGAFFIFILIWWMVLFTVLPFGAKPDPDRKPGEASSAPKSPMLLRKFVITTLIALVLTLMLHLAFVYGYIDLDVIYGREPSL